MTLLPALMTTRNRPTGLRCLPDCIIVSLQRIARWR